LSVNACVQRWTSARISAVAVASAVCMFMRFPPRFPVDLLRWYQHIWSMSKLDDAASDVPLTVTHRVRDTCLCLHAQRAARVLARRFDTALRPVGMTNGQFSLMMALSGPQPPPLSRIADVLGMDRTSLTAMLKPLGRRGWVEVRVDARDRRGRQPVLTPEGRAALARALPVWESEHAAVEAALDAPDALRQGLNALAIGG
jgi:DNA-binding MarR family transcriptional regulator